MSWHFLQEGGVACWQEKSLDGAPSALLNLMPGHAESCLTDNSTAASNDSLCGMTFEPSTANRGEAMSMSSPAASHAKTSASAGPVQESRAHGLDYGWKWPESFVRFDPASSSWRTRQCSLLEGLDEFSQTWPEWGWMRGGECSELRPLERPITEQGFIWLLTPTAQSWKAWTFRNPLALIRRNHADGNLQEQLMRLYQRMTTPRCQEILMMWPEGWTDSGPLETGGFQQWLHEQRIHCLGIPMDWPHDSTKPTNTTHAARLRSARLPVHAS